MQSQAPELRFTDVTFRRDGRPILRGVNWTIKKNECWVLLGRNGSGKSTLLSMIPALTYPTTGSVEVFGHTFGKHPWENIRKRTSFVSSTLHNYLSTLHGMTVEEIVLSGKYLTIGLYDEPTAEDMEQTAAMMYDFHLTHLREKRFATLSEGERRRTLTARALMNPAELLVLDEPCSSLDIRERESLLQALERRVENTEKTVLYVTHSLEEIMPFITHVAILEDGVMCAAGTKKEILTEDRLGELYHCRVRLDWDYDRPWMKIIR